MFKKQVKRSILKSLGKYISRWIWEKNNDKVESEF